MTCRAKCSHARRDSATQNNGQITQFRDGVSGEQVSYGYDSLNRLISASASSGAWGQSFTYDGFGNLLQKTVTQGSAPTLSVAVDPATNRMVGQSYDANGNLLYNGAVYDALNRVRQIYQYGSLNTEGYAYGPNNERVEKVITANGTSTYYTYLYGVDGCRLGVYQPDIDGTGKLYFRGGSAITPCFAGRMLYTKAGQLAVADRLGSIRPLNGSQTATTSYYPYGEEQPQQASEDTERFATYYRDSTNLDYAKNRYYASQFGRFITPDAGPFDLRRPQSLNRYTYVESDPVNFDDPAGLMKEDPACVDGREWWCSGSGVVWPPASFPTWPSGGPVSLSAIDQLDTKLYSLVGQGVLQSYTGDASGISFSFSLSSDMVESFVAGGALVLDPSGAATLSGIGVAIGTGAEATLVITVTGITAAAVVVSGIYQFAKQTNYILDGAKTAVRYRGPADKQKLCDYLNALYDAAGSAKERLEIYAALKWAGCQRPNKDRGGPNK